DRGPGRAVVPAAKHVRGRVRAHHKPQLLPPAPQRGPGLSVFLRKAQAVDAAVAGSADLGESFQRRVDAGAVDAGRDNAHAANSFISAGSLNSDTPCLAARFKPS